MGTAVLDCMIPQRHCFHVFLLLLVALSSGCAMEVTAYMSTDSRGNSAVDTFFNYGEEMHAIVLLSYSHPDTFVQLDLQGPGQIGLSDNGFYPNPDPKDDGDAAEINIQMIGLDEEGNTSEIGPWPVGEYTLDVFIDQNLATTVHYDVVEGIGAPSHSEEKTTWTSTVALELAPVTLAAENR